MINKVLVIFKTHLDIGFTDFSKNVVDRYMNNFIPNAVKIAKELREADKGARLVWTTGSWLISEYLRTHTGKEAEDVRNGIINGDICWHGLPFTTHTELMSKELFCYGLSLCRQLDNEFSKKTIAAKMTDVPGHTKAIIPYMKQYGIEFLHIGVNPASTVPTVPPIFRWKADNGDIINVMYQGEYGEFTEIGDTGIAVYFAHTGDNQGVQTADTIISLFEELRQKMPEAEIVAADLNDLAFVVKEIENELPIVTQEIGDSWIHGVGTDPMKISQFRALERLYSELPDGKDKDTLARGLIMIPEHTWGLNIHMNLADHEHYDREDFNEIRRIAPNFKKLEASWKEQRDYITDTVNSLSESTRQLACELISEYSRDNGQKRHDSEVPEGKILELGSFKLAFNAQGEICFLEKSGKIFADAKHRLMNIIYEQFCANDYKRFSTQYNRLNETWVLEDFTKPGIETGSNCYKRFEPLSANVYEIDGKVLVRYAFPKEAHRTCGCPLLIDAIISAKDEKLHLDIAWFAKPANRVAEALWVGFRPIAKNKMISKLGTLIDPKDVIHNGQSRLHATDFGVVYDEISIETLDAALVAPQEPSLLNFVNIMPLDDDAVHFNLYNNVWGTNFPMWYDENARFRFVIEETCK